MSHGFLYTLSAALWIIFFLFFGIDRSRYRNCLTLFLALSVTLYTILYSGGDRVIVFGFLVIFFLLLLVPLLLIWDGFDMIRREHFSKANILSLALGILIALGEISTLYLVFHTPYSRDMEQMMSKWLNICPLIFSVSIIYLSFSILMYVIYTLFLMIIPRKRDFDYVIIHGAGLINGERVTRLLADRCDKAIEIYLKDPTPPFLIPSGGKGPDEKISEAQAMKNYLMEKGIPEEHILLEDQSRTTYENLANSKRIIDSREGRKYTSLVTSNYHVYRALRYCRKIDFYCTGVGSRVALYYWPSALIREYIAVHAEIKHAVMFVLGWLLCVLFVVRNFL